MAPSRLSSLLASRQSSISVRSAPARLRAVDLEQRLKELGQDGPLARKLDVDVEQNMNDVAALSRLTSPLAVEYLDRLGRPVPALTPEIGVQMVGRAYVAHMTVEADATRYGCRDIPVLGTLPPLKKGRYPQDLNLRIVKATKRGFEAIRALPGPVWGGFVLCLTKRAHDSAQEKDYIAADVVDGLVRYGWVLRQVDLHYELEPERRHQ